MTPTPRRLLVALTGCLVIFRVASGAESGEQNLPALVSPETRATTVSGFAPLGDVQLYYEIHGAGEPILFVHGGGGPLRARGRSTVSLSYRNISASSVART
jgi:hypothetical protein